MKRGAVLFAGLLALGWLAQASARDTVYYYVSDTLHSEVVITDASRNVVERTHYAPYGQVLDRSMRDGPGYTGHEEDPVTGLNYMQQRYYDPQAGRFISTDPVLPTASGGNFNRYWYANDNPYRYTDQFGTCTGSHIGGVGCDSPSLHVTYFVTPSSKLYAAPSSASSHAQTVAHASTSGSAVSQNSGSSSTAVQSIESATATAAHWVRNRSSATAEAAAAFGPGVEGQATKQFGSAPDSTSGNFVVGEGAYIGATGNFQIFRWGQEASTGMAGKLIVDPTSYVRIKLGAGLSLGVSVDMYPHGGAVSVSVGGGLGEQAIVKPPATPSLEKNW